MGTPTSSLPFELLTVTETSQPSANDMYFHCVGILITEPLAETVTVTVHKLWHCIKKPALTQTVKRNSETTLLSQFVHIFAEHL